ncbi:UL5 protein [Gallid alphaherpesvirus 1]|uniref:UL5 protein n=1 Tax=Infectious laryngotracheitis virus TaxID=10386 RepID=H8ZRI3_ILTV|nr:UL5 protein [Gallid alphaherpesvirus 1]AFM36500.1 UL5 protein [Gallid alphaherpesvirus 1]
MACPFSGKSRREIEITTPVYLNFSAMQSIQAILSDITILSEQAVHEDSKPQLSWFETVARLDEPTTLPLAELPFNVYLITGNAGSGKSTCIQTLNETLNCIVTGSTRIAALNIFNKLSASYTSCPIHTIFQNFGFKGNNVQAVLGRFKFEKPHEQRSLAEHQMADIYYYWDVIKDITARAIDTASPVALSVLQTLQQKTSRKFVNLAPFLISSMPPFVKSNIILVDEAGVLGKHILTAIVYSWWLMNALWKTPMYQDGKKPVIVCIGSPTQTDAMESSFEHRNQRHLISSSINILSNLICTPTLFSVLNIKKQWAIFINNKRCSEPAFGEVLKAFEFGLPLTERHARFLDQFIVSESFIKDPSKLPGWTRLFSSHEEVKEYVSKLHAKLRTQKSEKYRVFLLPMYTIVDMAAFEKYKSLTGQETLNIDRWLQNNSSRLGNYSQSRDLDVTAPRFEYHRDESNEYTLVTTDASHVLNSQITVTKKVKKLIFGFEGTFEKFAHVLSEDSFLKTYGEDKVEFAYHFLSTLLYYGMIKFYEFLRTEGLPEDKLTMAYDRLYSLAMPEPETQNFDMGNGEKFCFNEDECPNADVNDKDDLFDIFDKSLDQFYLNYEICGSDVHGQEIFSYFEQMKRIYTLRYAVLCELFGSVFTAAPFSSFVGTASFSSQEISISSFKGAVCAFAAQTDTYTLRGITRARFPGYAEDTSKAHEWAEPILQMLDLPRLVVRDQMGFVSVLCHNKATFVDNIGGQELRMAITIDHGISSSLAMTITRSQGLSLDRVAICFSHGTMKLNTAYVAMSRVTSSEYLRMNLNPLRTKYEDTRQVSQHILRALRCKETRLVY